MKYIIDATNARLGRLATTVAKRSLLGHEIVIVNCEHAIISGTKKSVEKKWHERMELGQPSKGPFFSRMPDRFVRRVVRGMLPYKQTRGKDAFGRVQCYLGVPSEYKNNTLEKLEHADLASLKGTRFVTVQQICQYLRTKPLHPAKSG